MPSKPRFDLQGEPQYLVQSGNSREPAATQAGCGKGL